MEPIHAASQDAPPVAPAPQTRTVSLPLPQYPAHWTYALLAINIAVWVAMTVYGWLNGLGLGGSENGMVLYLFGAKFSPAIAVGQYWRLLTACFLHIGPVHLLFNAWALYTFGQQIERRYGGARFIALYLLAGIAGNVLSFMGSDSLSAGASGAIFGLIGAAIAYFLTYRDQFGRWGRQQLTNVLIVAGYNLVFGLSVGGIDNFGHIGGLLAGLALGWAYCPRYQVAEPTRMGGALTLVDAFSRRRAWLATVGVALLLALLTLLGVRAAG